MVPRVVREGVAATEAAVWGGRRAVAGGGVAAVGAVASAVRVAGAAVAAGNAGATIAVAAALAGVRGSTAVRVRGGGASVIWEREGVCGGVAPAGAVGTASAVSGPGAVGITGNAGGKIAASAALRLRSAGCEGLGRGGGNCSGWVGRGGQGGRLRPSAIINRFIESFNRGLRA